jgi:hypothetical protein
MSNPAIPRHKTAIRRGDLSRPIRSAIDSGMIDPATSVFDYGCGHGQDIALPALTWASPRPSGLACSGRHGCCWSL